MKKRLFISVALVLILTLLAPATVLAAKPVPFNATGEITSITDGTVKPAGDSGRWIVVERKISGKVTISDITSPFTLDFDVNYTGNVAIYTQAGNIHGRITTGSYVFNMNAKSQPLVLVGSLTLPGIGEVPVYKLTITGHWSIIQGAHGEGDLSASVCFIPTPDGHVGQIVDSAWGFEDSTFNLTGQWQP